MEKRHPGFKYLDGLDHPLSLKNLGCTRWMARFALIHPTMAKSMGSRPSSPETVEWCRAFTAGL